MKALANLRDGKTIKHTLEEQGKEGNHEDQEDTDNTAVDPLEDWREVVAAERTEESSSVRVTAERQLRLEGT